MRPPGEMVAPLVANFSASTPTFGGQTHAALRTPNAFPWLPLVTWLWGAGVLTLGVRFAGGWWHVSRLTVRGTVPVSPEWQRRLKSLQAQLEVRRPVRLLESSRVRSPLVIGWIRPIILLPVGLLTGLPTAQVEAVLLHELAHIRGHDFLINLAQRAAETLLFYHPAVWWISGQIRREREHRCDDCVVRALGDGRSLAGALLTLAERSEPSPAFALAAEGGSVADRVRRLLGARPTGSPTANRAWRWVALVVILLALGAWLVPRWTAPMMFQSAVRLRIERTLPTGNPQSAAPYDPYFLSTQFEILKSSSVLFPVVVQADLAKRWGVSPAEALTRLSQRVQVRPYRNTSIVEILVVSEDRREAADLANLIAEVYTNLGRDARAAEQDQEKMRAERRLADLDHLIEAAVQTEQEFLQKNPVPSPNSWKWQEIRNEIKMLQELKLQKRREIISANLDRPATPTEWIEVIDRAEPGLRPIRWYASVR